ncbi:MAG: hypothetical protein HY819_02320 [Acidobacteria bacterium]|nr:hypothetical protein [Acidobacteriota bacterium]
MGRIQVKSEFLPTRCEICHQSDWFDATNGFCHRCDSNSVVKDLKNLVPIPPPPQITNTAERQLMPFSLFLAVVGTFLISFLSLAFISDILTANFFEQYVIGRLFWLILASTYLVFAWLSLLTIGKKTVPNELLIIFLCFIFGIFIILTWVAINSTPPSD